MAKMTTPSGNGKYGRPRVLVDNGEYWLNNKGDLAILHVTVRRLRERWPQAEIGVITNAPALLSAFEPEAVPVCYRRGGDWPGESRRRDLAAAVGPETVGFLSDLLLNTTTPPRHALRRVSDLVRGLSRSPGDKDKPLRNRSDAEAFEFPEVRSRGGLLPNAVDEASAVIAMGGGYLTDVDEYQSHRTLALLERAIERRVPTALLGQGIGPMDDPELIAHAERVLPRVDFIALREQWKGPDVLRRLGVPDSRVAVTGDDAVELGYRVRKEDFGVDLGVCLRVADYSPVAVEARRIVETVVRGAAARSGAVLVPLIVSEHLKEDRRATLPLLEGFPSVARPLSRFAPAERLAEEVSRCRLIVTGAYHVAVFALSQGIPVVGLSSSRYYDDKLGGLGDMFGTGFVLVRLGDGGFQAALADAVRELWDGAESYRPILRARAVGQIEASRKVFEIVAAMVDDRAEI